MFSSDENWVQWQTCKKNKVMGPIGLCQVRIYAMFGSLEGEKSRVKGMKVEGNGYHLSYLDVFKIK